MEALGGLDEEENKKPYDEALAKGDAGWGVDGRLTTYAGAGVGLVKEIKKARDILKEVREGGIRVLEELGNTKLTYKGHIDQRLRGGLVSYSCPNY